jgi:hypothetical protein
MLSGMETIPAGRYGVILPNDTLSSAITSLQTRLYRELGLFQARFFPPMVPLFLLKHSDFSEERPVRSEEGRSIGKEIRTALPGLLHYTTPKAFSDGSMGLPLREDESNALSSLLSGISGAQALSSIETVILILPGNTQKKEKEKNEALRLAKNCFPTGGTLTKWKPALLDIKTIDEDGIAWTLYPLIS